MVRDTVVEVKYHRLLRHWTLLRRWGESSAARHAHCALPSELYRMLVVVGTSEMGTEE